MVYIAPTLANGNPYDASMWQAALDEIARLSARSVLPFVIKSVDELLPASTTLQDDDELHLPLAALTKYRFNLWLSLNSGTTPDFKLGWSVPSGTVMAWSFQEGTPGSLPAVLQGPFTAASVPPINGIGADQVVIAEGIVSVSGTPGTLKLQWAQNTSNPSNTTVRANSWLSLTPA